MLHVLHVLFTEHITGNFFLVIQEQDLVSLGSLQALEAASRWTKFSYFSVSEALNGCLLELLKLQCCVAVFSVNLTIHGLTWTVHCACN